MLPRLFAEVGGDCHFCSLIGCPLCQGSWGGLGKLKNLVALSAPGTSKHPDGAAAQCSSPSGRVGKPPPRPGLTAAVCPVSRRAAWGAPKNKMRIFDGKGPGTGVPRANPVPGHGQDKAPGVGGHLWAFGRGKAHGFSSHQLAQPKSLSLTIFQITQHRLLALWISSALEVLGHWSVYAQ